MKAIYLTHQPDKKEKKKKAKRGTKISVLSKENIKITKILVGLQKNWRPIIIRWKRNRISTSKTCKLIGKLLLNFNACND